MITVKNIHTNHMKSIPLCITADIETNFNLYSLQRKTENKTDLQKELGWPAEPRRPVVFLPTNTEGSKGGVLFEAVLPGLRTLPMEFLVVENEGDSEFNSLLKELHKTEKHRLHFVNNKKISLQQMYAASDMILFFADPSDASELEEAMKFAVVPVAPACEKLENYDPVQESGTAFIYEKETPWHCFAAVVRALETYRFPFDWKTIQKQVLGIVG